MMCGMYSPSVLKNNHTTLVPNELRKLAVPDRAREMHLCVAPVAKPAPQAVARVKLDATLFDPTLLKDEVVLETALGILAGHLQNPAVDWESLLRDLASIPNLFELVFSGVDESVADSVINKLVAHFPTKYAAFDSSLAGLLSSRLSHYFWLLNYPSADIREWRRTLELTCSVLKALSTMSFGFEAQSPTTDDNADEFDGLVLVKRSKQKDRKKARRATRTVSIDTKPFELIGVDVPRSQEEAEFLEKELMDDVKQILTLYLRALREPQLLDTYRKAYIKDSAIEEVWTDEDKSINTDNDAGNASRETPPALSVYPLVQPMKAAFYFDSVDGFGDWHILISTRADRNLREAKRSDQKSFAIILKKIKELSNGHFSDDNQKRLTGSDNAVPIYEAKMTRDTRLVYQVDCIKEFEADIERQVLRIFGIYTHAQLGRDFWTAMSQHLAERGKEYKKRCTYRSKPQSPGDKVFSPATFPPNNDIAAPMSPAKLPDLRAEDQQELHSLLVLEKFVTFSQALLNSILADQDVAHVFHMSTAEQEIVKHSGSCFVLGRSGTGKTTTMLFKMLGIEKACDNLRAECEEDIPRPRQLFVTQSRVLAEKVEEYYVKLAASHAAALRTAEESSKLAARQKTREEQGLVDRDEEELHRGTLPKAFSDLRDEHFPLFVTFDHLCRLLEADLRKMDKHLGMSPVLPDSTNGVELSTTASDYMLQRRNSFVSYGTFLREYWPHLPQGLTKTLDPALIFAEFMGVIKGSEDSIQTNTGFLGKEQYLAISHRQQGTFASRRDAVYTLFQAYMKLKRERRHWDAADRTHAILGGLREMGVQGRKLDFIYVDEAQDNLLVDALVLRTMCKNPDGLFWAGDTAQTISVGSSFRFDDLKAFLYRLETPSLEWSTKSPKSFQLTVNYRSHGGIVNCAHSVVQLITKFWPHAIDSLSEERGIVNGIKPVFFSGWDQDTVQYEQFLFGASGSQIEFGAQQCILVRDDAAREKLRKQVGDIGLVLTLYESKGLEFNDVLLFNFFEDSTVDVAQWRVILNALPAQKHLKCPQFDEARHSGVCRELKFLYVAVTRARKNLWIADCSDKGEPLRTYWNHKNLVSNLLAADNIPRLATTSTEEEWAETARTLFDNKRYLQAVRCYERANLVREKDVAYAYFLREQARTKPVSRGTVDNPRKIAFLEAAAAFSACAASAVVERLVYYRNAAECYLEGSELGKAAKSYVLAEDYTRGAQLYRQAGLFDEAVDTIEDHKAHVREVEAEKILNVAKLHYVKEQKLDRATRLFPDIEKALEFMEDYGFDVARVKLLESYGRFGEAAEIHLVEGRTAQAIRLFLKDSSTEYNKRAESSLLQGLWRHLSFGASIGPDARVGYSSLGELLALSSEIESRCTQSPCASDELAMFHAIIDGHSTQLRALAENFLHVHNDLVAATLCLDFAFRKPMKTQTATVEEMVSMLEGFNAYARQMQRLLSEHDPCQLAWVRKLFGFFPVADSENLFHVPSGSFLHASLERSRTFTVVAPAEPDQSISTIWDITNALQKDLPARLRKRVTDQLSDCAGASALRPCPAILVLGGCFSANGCNFGHNNISTERGAFELRVRLILQQVLIYQTAGAIEERHVQDSWRQLWLAKLYHTLFPIHAKLGSFSELNLDAIPEAEKAKQVIREWLRDILYTASFSSIGRLRFLSFIAEIASLTLLLDKDNAETSFGRAPCVTQDRPREYIRNQDCYIVDDLLQCLSCNSGSSMPMGVLFIKAVIDKQVPLDASVLCHLVEQLCAAHAISYRLRRYGSLHDLTLTRSRILALYGNEAMQEQDQSLLTLLVNLIPALLGEMYNARPGFLLYDGSLHIDYNVRNVLVARLCKSFTLLGYNIPDRPLKNDILRNITSLKRHDRRLDVRYPKIYFRYVNAGGWNSLVAALRTTGVDDQGTADEIINLQQAGKPDFHRLRGTRHIVFKRASDIGALIRGEKVVGSDLNPEAPEFVPTRPAQLQAQDDQGQDLADVVDDGLNAPPDEEDTGIDHSADIEAAAQAVDKERVEHAAVPPTNEELVAAAYIARAYRRKLVRKKAAPRKGREAEKNRMYLSFSRSRLAQNIGLKYRVMYLGPLPLVLICLEVMNTHVIESKKKARAQKEIVDHSQYEALMAQIARAIAINKRIQTLKNMLKPDSPFHKKQSVGELRTHVMEVLSVAEDLPEGVTRGIEQDLKMAARGIVEERKPPKQNVPRPDLVLDIDEFQCY